MTPMPAKLTSTAREWPPWNGTAMRRHIGGIIANNPGNMVRSLLQVQQFDSLPAMPALGVTTKAAQDLPAFLSMLDGLE